MASLENNLKSVSDHMEKFYALNIPSVGIEVKFDEVTTPASIVKLSKNQSIYRLDLTPVEDVILPPRLEGQPPVLDDVGLQEQKERWSSLYEKPLKFSTTGLSPTTNNIISLSEQGFSEVIKLAKYSPRICAAPGCQETILESKQCDHLNLCDEHQSELDTVLQNYQKSYDIVIPQDVSSDDVHNMIYNVFLPTIDQSIKNLSSSTDTHHKYVAQVLFAFKACIYIYRMHLNPSTGFIQVIMGLFLNALRQNRPVMIQSVAQTLRLLVPLFAICGIVIIWTADLILSDDAHLAIALMAGGLGLGLWGTIMLAVTAINVTTTGIGAPIAAMAGGATLFGIGRFMFAQRLTRNVPHNYCVVAHINLNNARNYLQQWMPDGF